MNRLGRLSFVFILPLFATQARAVTRGGQMVFGRYANSQFLASVFNHSNSDIRVLTNLYNTLLQPGSKGKSVMPSLG